MTTPEAATIGEYIVYACPRGPLAAQIEAYFASSLAAYGPNTAHRYMPHCTLTGFFPDQAATVPAYAAALAGALSQARGTRPAQPLAVLGLECRPDFHGLLLDGPWLERLVADFAAAADSPTRRSPLRLKSWLHLSLAYGFAPAQHEPLAALARAMVDPAAAVTWELCFYERHGDGSWVCHAAWDL